MKQLKLWWEGKYVPPQSTDYVIVLQGSYERHWTSKAAHRAADFWLKYWQWCMGFGLAAIGVILKH